MLIAADSGTPLRTMLRMAVRRRSWKANASVDPRWYDQMIEAEAPRQLQSADPPTASRECGAGSAGDSCELSFVTPAGGAVQNASVITQE